MLGGLLLTLVAFSSFLVVFLGFMGLMGKLPPNPWAGIRTAFTRRSEENWYNTHRAAAPVMMFGGILVFAVAGAFLPFAYAGNISETVSLIIVGVCGVLTLITVVLSWYAGTAYAAARAIHEAGDAP